MTTVRQHLEAARHELGVPSDDYPAPVANAVKHITMAIDLLNAGSRTSGAGNDLIVVLDQPRVNA